MMECVYLLFVLLHFSAGCNLSNISDVSVNKGGSVLLPCSCTDPKTKSQTFTWKFIRNGGHWTYVFSDGQFTGRFQTFNENSPANLSLLISHLREEDQGTYRCQAEKEMKDVQLYVKACDLVKGEPLQEVTGFSGESVVLRCSCTDPQTKPNTVRWTFKSKTSANSNFEEIYPAQTGKHRDRVRLTNQNSGDLSLLISHLTEEDQGEYRCEVQGDTKDFRLHIKVRDVIRPSTTPTDSTTHPPLEFTTITTSSSPEPSTGEDQTTSSIHQGVHILMVVLLLLFGAVAITCSGWRGRRGGQNSDCCRTSGS
ncbi:junctional adhesion molecule-like [Hoplias malabaricus]|uniref:junctional adhesion molecule-like n=1 Tax=Hoplias malabaricus TaxID=27720 RepID=UPI0034624A9E